MSRSAALRSPAFRALDAVSVVAFGLLWTGAALRLAAQAGAVELATLVLLALLPAMLAADLASGVVHWFADTFFAADSRWIGPLLIEPFRAHHRDPGEIVTHGWLQVSSNSCLVCVPLLVALLAWPPLSPLGRVLHVFTLALVALVALTNHFHKWAHAPRAPRAIGWLQRSGVVLTPARHARHHQGGFSRSFCVTTGWLNPWLDAAGVFPALERALLGAAEWLGRRPLARRPRAR